MNPIRASLRFPQVTLAITAILVLTGLAAFFNMPRREDPKITTRSGLIIAMYPGATSEEVENQVTRKIEENLFHFSEVRREKTYSTTRNGIVIVIIELNKSVKNTDEFWSKLRFDLVQLKQTDLPSGVQGPIVDSDFGDTVAVLIAIRGGHYGYRELTDYAKRVETAIRQLPAVSKIKRVGDQTERIELTGSRERLSQYGVDPQQVVQALRGRNTIEYGGRIPSGTDKVLLNANGTLQTEDQIRNIMVNVSPSGQPIYLGDLGTVERVYEDPTEYVRIGGERTILLSVEVHEGNNIVQFGKELHQTLARVLKTLPPDVQLEFLADQPRTVGEHLSDFFREFGIAILSVILVTMLLLPLRVALVSAVAIPVTVSITFAVLNAAGIELHQVSIAALIVVLGMVVDDAIVIADNYVDLLDRKVAAEEASRRSATEMAIPVLTATLTIVASFLPLLLLTGTTGEFIRALPITVSIALGVSFIVAMLLTPMTAGFFIRKGLHDHDGEAGNRKLTPLDHMQRYYNIIISWAMRHRRKILICAGISFVVGFGILGLVPQQFFPLAERDQFIMDVWLPEGSRIEATDAAIRQIETVLQKNPDIRSYASFIGSSSPRFYYNVNPQPPAANYAQILINTDSAKKTPELIEEFRSQLPAVAPEAQVFVEGLQQGDQMSAPVEVRISGDDLDTLRSLGSQVENILNRTPGAIYVHTDWHDDELLAGVDLRQEVANRLGFTNSTVARQLADGFDGEPVTTFWEGDRAVDVDIRLDPDERKSFQSVSDMYVVSPVTGARVPIEAMASLSPEWHPSRIVRRNGVRTLTVLAFPDDGRLASQILADSRKQIGKLQLPAGYRIDYGGEEENQNETFSEMMHALFISLILIFLILLFQFRTFADAMVVLAAIPLALPGAAVGLFLTHNSFGFTAFIGLISLGGLVVRNSIILVDYIHARMRQGIALEEAALEAGERRLRPIFLTTMAAAIGVTPMIISRSSLWSPLASVIAFGLLLSMFFTLIVIPILFVAVNQKKCSKVPGAFAATAALLVLLCFVPSAQAEQRKTTLNEAIQLALHDNANVKLAIQNAKIADAKLLEARANYFPEVTNQTYGVHVGQTESLTIPAGILGTYSGTGQIPGHNTKIELGSQNFVLSTTQASQPLSQLFKIHSGVTAAQAEAKMAHLDLDKAQNVVVLNVKKAYYQLLSAQLHKHAAELRLEAGQEQLKEAQDAAKKGITLQVTALEGEAQVASASHSLGALEDNIADMQNTFDDLIGLPLGTETQLEEPAEPQEAPVEGGEETNDLLNDALAHNPEMLSARQSVRAAHATLNAAHDQYIPDISLFAQNVYESGVPLLPHNTRAVGIRVDWTVTEFGKRIGIMRERKAELTQAEVNLHSTENRVRMDVESETRKVRRSQSGLEAARKNVAVRAELERILEEQVKMSTATEATLRDAQAQLAEAKAQLFEAEMQHVISQEELLNSLGRY